MKKWMMIPVLVIGLSLTGCSGTGEQEITEIKAGHAEEVNQLKAELEEMSSQLEEKNAAVDKLSSDLSKVKVKNTRLTSENQELVARNDALVLDLEAQMGDFYSSKAYNDLQNSISTTLEVHDGFYTDVIWMHQAAYDKLCKTNFEVISPNPARELYIQAMHNGLVTHENTLDQEFKKDHTDTDGNPIEELKDWYKVTEEGYRTEAECRETLSAVFTDDMVDYYMSKVVGSPNYEPKDYNELKLYEGETYTRMGYKMMDILDGDAILYYPLINMVFNSEASDETTAVYTVQLPTNSSPEIGGSFSLYPCEETITFKLTDRGWRIHSQVANLKFKEN